MNKKKNRSKIGTKKGGVKKLKKINTREKLN